jgi:hypothetical protein
MTTQKIYPHPSTTIDQQVLAMRADLALVHHAIIGALNQQDHSDLSSLGVADSLLLAFSTRFDAITAGLDALEALAKEIREKGAPTVEENMRAHPHEVMEAK